MPSDFALFLGLITIAVAIMRAQWWVFFIPPMAVVFAVMFIFLGHVDPRLVIAICCCYGVYAVWREQDHDIKVVFATAYCASLSVFLEDYTFFLMGTLAILFFYYTALLDQREEPITVPGPDSPRNQPLIFVSKRAAISPEIAGYAIPDGYRLACLYFGTGLIDRTGTLDHGFPYKVLDPIPENNISSSGYSESSLPISYLVRSRARELVLKARAQNKGVTILWSGGIDSTAACIALMEQLSDEPDRLQIAYTFKSVMEYWNFYRQFVLWHPNTKRISRMSDVLLEDRLIVTGEHGDQLFGSMKAIDLDPDILLKPWVDAFPAYLDGRFATKRRGEIMLDYLRPQIEASPVPIVSVYDLLWWMNFSMKWQAVALRMPASLGEGAFTGAEQRIHHFYQTQAFQLWSLNNPHKRIKGTDWTTYKWPLKEYIYQSTKHERYYLTKKKVPSLKGMTSCDLARFCLAVDADRRYLMQRYNNSLKDKGPVDYRKRRETGGGVSVKTGSSETVTVYDVEETTQFNKDAECEMWADLDEGGE